MRTLLLLLASAAIWTSSASAASQDALWRCVGPDGREILTDQAQGLKDCQKYDVKSEKAEARPAPKQSDSEIKLEPTPSRPVVAEERRAAEPPETGLIDFGTVNRLALGMTDAEVLNIAGPPKSKLPDAWIYALAEDASMVEIRFGNGRILEIRSHRSPQ